MAGNYNKSGYDRTSWYSLTERYYAFGHFDQMESNKVTQPIPDSKPDSKTKAKILAEMQDQFTVLVIKSFNNITGKNIKVTPQRHRLIEARNKDGNGMVQFEAVFKFKNKEWANDVDMKKYLRLETLLAPSRFIVFSRLLQIVLKMTWGQ